MKKISWERNARRALLGPTLGAEITLGKKEKKTKKHLLGETTFCLNMEVSHQTLKLSKFTLQTRCPQGALSGGDAGKKPSLNLTFVFILRLSQEPGELEGVGHWQLEETRPGGLVFIDCVTRHPQDLVAGNNEHLISHSFYESETWEWPCWVPEAWLQVSQGLTKGSASKTPGMDPPRPSCGPP